MFRLVNKSLENVFWGPSVSCNDIYNLSRTFNFKFTFNYIILLHNIAYNVNLFPFKVIQWLLYGNVFLSVLSTHKVKKVIQHSVTRHIGHFYFSMFRGAYWHLITLAFSWVGCGHGSEHEALVQRCFHCSTLSNGNIVGLHRPILDVKLHVNYM